MNPARDLAAYCAGRVPEKPRDAYTPANPHETPGSARNPYYPITRTYRCLAFVGAENAESLDTRRAYLHGTNGAVRFVRATRVGAMFSGTVIVDVDAHSVYHAWRLCENATGAAPSSVYLNGYCAYPLDYVPEV